MKKVNKSDTEWKDMLSESVYNVTRKKGTEAPFSGALNKNIEIGTYHCACCDNVLFESTHKFDSGTGWPSFFKPINPEHVATKEDSSLFMKRTEVICNKCNSHLGHVFPDGPQPTGLRFCINSASLELKKK